MSEIDEISKLIHDYNLNVFLPSEIENNELIRNAFNCSGNFYITPPFYCESKKLHLGKSVYINTGCIFLNKEANIYIGDNTLIGPGVHIYCVNHPVEVEKRTSRQKGVAATWQDVKIGNNVWIGGNSIILPGVTIGDNTVIAAGSIVTKDIPANVVALGSPAKIVKEL